jgi:hypothetical protein
MSTRRAEGIWVALQEIAAQETKEREDLLTPARSVLVQAS